VLETLRDADAGTLLHTWRAGQASVPALLDDYAFLIQGLVALAHATGDEGWTREAARLQEEQDRRLLDAVHGGYFAGDGADLLFRAKPAFDGAVASGNGTSARNLLALAELTGNADYAARSAAVTAAFAESMTVVPLGHVTLAHAIFQSTRGPQAASAVERAAALPAVPSAGASSGVFEDLEDLARDVVAVQAGVQPGFDSWRPFTLDLVVRDGWHIGAHGTPSPELVSTSLHAVLGKVRESHVWTDRPIWPQFVQVRTPLAAPRISTWEGSRPDKRAPYSRTDQRDCSSLEIRVCPTEERTAATITSRLAWGWFGIRKEMAA
jgi:hypothetical protein